MKRISRILVYAFLALGIPWAVQAQVPGLVSYQARIVDEQTGPVNDTRSMVFAIYTQPEGGSAIWTEQQNVTIVEGLVNVLLGSVTPLTSQIFQGSERYLGVKIGSDPEMTPRKRLLAVPYALRAEAATIRLTPSGGISSTDVTAAISELDAEKLALTGGTLTGRLNVYNDQGNDVGLDAVSADSVAVQAVNSGSRSPAMVAYNWGEGNGMYSFAEGGNALWAINNSDDYVTLYAANNGQANVLKAYSKGSFPTVFSNNDGSGLGIYGYSKGSNGIEAVTDSPDYAAFYALNTTDATAINANGNIYVTTTNNNALNSNNESEYPTVAGTNNGEGAAVYGHAIGVGAAISGYSEKGSAGAFYSDASDYWTVFINAANDSQYSPGLKVNGYATITGGVSSTMLTSAGTARTHGITSPQAEISFSGSSRLSHGEAEIKFPQTWQDCMSGVGEYRVLVTPTELCNGVCCVEKKAGGFRVKELMNGSSDASFDWMVQAIQKGSSTEQTMLAGTADNVGMEIIDETAEQPPQMRELIARQQALDKQMADKRKAAAGQRAALSSGPESSSGANVPASMTAGNAQTPVERVEQYKASLKQKAQRQ